MKMKKLFALLLAMTMVLGGCGSKTDSSEPQAAEITITDMIGREVTVTPGSYERVVCVGAGALRMYSYIGDTALLCGVEDIDNTTLEERHGRGTSFQPDTEGTALADDLRGFQLHFLRAGHDNTVARGFYRRQSIGNFVIFLFDPCQFHQQ